MILVSAVREAIIFTLYSSNQDLGLPLLEVTHLYTTALKKVSVILSFIIVN